MSDVKQAILDEIEVLVRKSDDKEKSSHLDYPLTACVNYRAGLLKAEQVMIKALDGYVIVPEKATEEMTAVINNEKMVYQSSGELYKALLKSFKEQS